MKPDEKTAGAGPKPHPRVSILEDHISRVSRGRGSKAAPAVRLGFSFFFSEFSSFLFISLCCNSIFNSETFSSIFSFYVDDLVESLYVFLELESHYHFSPNQI